MSFKALVSASTLPPITNFLQPFSLPSPSKVSSHQCFKFYQRLMANMMGKHYGIRGFDFGGEMEGLRGSGLVSALPPPRPKSPPEYPDLYGKRRELAKIQMLEREIGFLEEELKSADGFQQASRSCKEVAEFVTSNADPLIPTSGTKEIRRPHGFGKWLCGVPCFNVSGICTIDPEMPPCSKCRCSSLCVSCRVPKFACCSCLNTGRLNKSKCCWNCCIPKFPSCITCSCSSIKCSTSPKCLEVNFCSCFKNCCYPSYFCY